MKRTPDDNILIGEVVRGRRCNAVKLVGRIPKIARLEISKDCFHSLKVYYNFKINRTSLTLTKFTAAECLLRQKSQLKTCETQLALNKMQQLVSKC